MLTAPARPPSGRPGTDPPAPRRGIPTEIRQRRAAAVLAVILAASVVGAIATGAEGLWVTAVSVAVVAVGYLVAVVRVRRLAAARMAAAFTAGQGLDWETFERHLSGAALAAEGNPGGAARPPASGFDREVLLFVGAWALGLVLTPILALVRLVGGNLGDPGRHAVIGRLVRLQAYGRSRSMRVLAAGLFATAGVSSAGVIAGGGAAYAAPAQVTTTGLHEINWSDATSPDWDAAARTAADRALRRKQAAKRAKRARAAALRRSGEALSVALAQVGKPYVYGAAGPYSFDCSGLTMYAWAAVGVWLPHNSASQYYVTTHINESQLRPGDLVFYYGPDPGHVAMYIGNGQVVSANTTGTNVQTQPITWDGMPTGFSRVQ